MSSDREAWEDERPHDPHIWRTLGYRRTAVEHGLMRVEFFRAGRPGLLRAEGRVLHKTRRVAFCGGSLVDAAGAAIASARCTQILRTKDA